MRTVDRYRIEAELDSGGFGTVYRARHAVIGRVVALKLLHPSRESSLEVIERFLREARILSAISSPHVVQVIDAGMTEDRQIFLAMELLEGESLAKRIQRAGPLAIRDAIRVAREIAIGLAAAHAAGIVHRDLKPANVFLARTPDGREIAKVLDFGISKSRGRGGESVITMTGAVLGTPHYMAPEQLHGARDVDGRADLYALAVCLYEMLSGQLPYEASSLESLISQRLSEPHRPLSERSVRLPDALISLVDRGLARDPDARFRSAIEMEAALAGIEGGSLPATTPPQRSVVEPPVSASPVATAPVATTPSARAPSPTEPSGSG
ncbi:MAG: serine/threonine protein kinase, partial [Myxococcota bacterium]|nr:serine/threonine protein kinase [Myxococcota bacterium]